MDDPRWMIRETAMRTRTTSTSTGSNSGAKGHLIPATTTLGTATRMFANETGIRAIATHAMYFSTRRRLS